MGVRDRFRAGLAGQLRRPEGMRGRVVAWGLNRSNRETVAMAVRATEVQPGQVAADIGFGGGIGLPMLLAQVRPGGHVLGVDLSATMIDRARRKLRREARTGLLVLRQGSITALPTSDASLDAVITINTIYFVADLSQAFAEIARVLRAPGRVVVGLGDPAGMAKDPLTNHGFTIRSVDVVVAALEGAGLTLVDHLRVGSGELASHLLVGSKPESAPLAPIVT